MDAEGLEDATFSPVHVQGGTRCRPGRDSARRRAPLLAAAILLTSAALAAQGGPAMLRVQPRVGDTLHMRFEQDVSMTGRTKLNGRDTTFTSRTSLLVLARLIVRASDSTGCTLLAITDSVSVLTLQAQALSPGESARRAMQGREILLRVKADGSASYVRASGDLDPDVGALVSSMPAVLSPHPVAVGAMWESAMTVPLGGDEGKGAHLRARYRFDSLSATGALAYVGLTGSVTRDSSEGALRSGRKMASHGTVSGSFVLDRRRGWWAEARVTVTIASTYTPAPAPGAPPGSAPPPVAVQTRLTQHVHDEGAHGTGSPPR